MTEYPVSRRMSYLRWRLRTGKDITEEQRVDLNCHDSKMTGAHLDAMNQLSFEDMVHIQRKSITELEALTRDAGLLPGVKEVPTKKKMLERVRLFKQLSLRGALKQFT